MRRSRCERGGGSPTRSCRCCCRLLRLIVAVMAAWTVTAMFSAQLADEPAPSSPGVANPVGWLPLDDVEDPPTAGYLQATFVVSIVVATVSLVLRYRRSKGRERIQLRWIACGAIATIVGFIAVTAAPLPQSTINRLHAVVIPLMPLSIGVAVLRHNLYDIDRLISRTVAYAAVTALLAATYVVLAVVVPMVVDVRGDLAVAASTLVVELDRFRGRLILAEPEKGARDGASIEVSAGVSPRGGRVGPRVGSAAG